MAAIMVWIQCLMMPISAEPFGQEFAVVGVDHALDMDSRSGGSRLQIHLKKVASSPDLKVGMRLTVHRVADGAMGGSDAEVSPGSDGELDADQSATKDVFSTEVPIRLLPAPQVGTEIRSHSDVDGHMRQRPQGTLTDGLAPSSRTWVPLRVGVIEVVGVQDDIWVAEMVQGDAAPTPEGPTATVVRSGVQIGDYAQVIRPKKKKKPPVVEDRQVHRAQLEKERDRLLRRMKMKRRKADPYQRKMNRWDL